MRAIRLRLSQPRERFTGPPCGRCTRSAPADRAGLIDAAVLLHQVADADYTGADQIRDSPQPQNGESAWFDGAAGAAGSGPQGGRKGTPFGVRPWGRTV